MKAKKAWLLVAAKNEAFLRKGQTCSASVAPGGRQTFDSNSLTPYGRNFWRSVRMTHVRFASVYLGVFEETGPARCRTRKLLVLSLRFASLDRQPLAAKRRLDQWDLGARG